MNHELKEDNSKLYKISVQREEMEHLLPGSVILYTAKNTHMLMYSDQFSTRSSK